MPSSNSESATSGPINLLERYSFESNGQSYESVLNSWLERFPLSWVNLALVESLHQGRYKVVSVEQILTLWQRRGKPSYHFNHDFERLVSNNLPRGFESTPKKSTTPHPASRSSSRRQRYTLESQPSFQQPALPQYERLELDHAAEPPESTSPQPFWTRLGFDVTGNSNQTDNRPVSTANPAKPQLDGLTPDRIEGVEAQSFDVPLANDGDETTWEEASEQSETTDTSFPISVPDSSSHGNTVNPIHQFVPQTTAGVIHEKLTAMAQINV